MQSLLTPANEWELSRMLGEASARRSPIEVMGRGSKRAVGRPTQASAQLTTSGLSGVILYEPTELVMAVRSGTPLADVEADLDSRGQMLAFEPIDLGPMLGGAPDRATIGSVFATNLSGSRRIAAGAARDHILGISAVTGDGTPFRSGGRVMKNVTGYDVARGLMGSWGTLAVMTEVTFKVLPRPEEAATLVLFGLEDSLAVEALSLAMASPYEVSGAVHLQAALAARLGMIELQAERRAVTAVRVENFSASVSYRVDRLRETLKVFGEIAVLDHDSTEMFWRELRQLSVLTGISAPLWRISTAPTHGPKVVAAISRYMDCRAFYDWSGGLIWAEVPSTSDAGATDIRRIMASHGGHATLIRAEPGVRAAVDVFQPLESGLDDISRKLKALFDPAGILNPGRMYA